MNRRSLLIGIGSALAAPAIVRADSLMKIVVPKPVLLASDDEIVLSLKAASLQALSDMVVFGTGYIARKSNGLYLALPPDFHARNSEVVEFWRAPPSLGVPIKLRDA